VSPQQHSYVKNLYTYPICIITVIFARCKPTDSHAVSTYIPFSFHKQTKVQVNVYVAHMYANARQDSVVGVATTLLVGRPGDRILAGDDFSLTRPDRLCDPPTLLYNGYRVILAGKAAGA
jgi:hypothetical protein